MAENILTINDFDFQNLDMPFVREIDRIKYISKAYRKLSIADAFSKFYNVGLSDEVKSSKDVNVIHTIEIGKTYCGQVKEINKSYITFEIPGVKEELECRENFSDCIPNIQEFLLTHNNSLLFNVKEKKHNKFIVSVLDAYYKKWQKIIENAIKHENGIYVHIDSLVNGGYICHTQISSLVELTGRNYTHSVFIPGSHIVLNIERDFSQWIGKDVMIIPQNFVKFKHNFKTGETENSLVGSRKHVLKIEGTVNLLNLYNDWQKHELLDTTGSKWVSPVFDGVVTGVINSKNKIGIFVEITDQSITGLVPVDESELLDYHPGDKVKVQIDSFEVQEDKKAFIINRNTKKIVKCNTRAVLKLV